MTEQDQEHVDHEANAIWAEVLSAGHLDKPYSYLSGHSRCGMCQTPLSGVSGVLMKALRGRIPSRKNPALCNL